MKPSLWIVAVFLLAGCTQDLVLKSDDGKDIGHATLDVAVDNTAKVKLWVDGKEYQGTLAGKPVDEGARIAAKYGVGSRQYRNHVRGWDRPARHGKVTLVAEDGEALECQVTYRGANGHGNCISDQRKFAFVVEDRDA